MKNASTILVALAIATGVLHQADRLGTAAGTKRYGQPQVRQITREEMRARHEQILLEMARLELPRQFAAAPAPRKIPKPPRPLDALYADLGIAHDNTTTPDERSPAAIKPAASQRRAALEYFAHPAGSIAQQIDSEAGAK